MPIDRNSRITIDRNRKDPFTVLDNGSLQNHSISFRARGLWAYLMSLPDDWVVLPKYLADQSKETLSAIRRSLQELRSAGLATLTRDRDDGGHLKGSCWVIHEIAVSNELTEIKENGISVENGDSSDLTEIAFRRNSVFTVSRENETYTKERLLQKKDSKKKKETRPKSKSEKGSEGFGVDSWQMKQAVRFASLLKKNDCLTRVVERSTGKDRERHMQAWAAVFDKLHRIDGYSVDEIDEVVDWLFKPGNWWIEKRAICTAIKFRDTKRDSGERYFDIMAVQMRSTGVKAKIPATRRAPKSLAAAYRLAPAEVVA